MPVQIYGAGMAGLLAAQILRRHDPAVCEAAPSLPDNHGALLRFRTDAVARATHQQFKKVRVSKALMDSFGDLQTQANLRDSNQYSYKVTGEMMTRSIMDLSPVDRYIAPDDFIHELGRHQNITFGYAANWERLGKAKEDGIPVISTIPMPALMDILEWPNKPDFKYLPIWSITARIVMPATNLYQTIYYPNPADKRYRASITGDHLIIELVREPDASQIWNFMWATLNEFGFPPDKVIVDEKVKHQKYGKLLPIDERSRKEFILFATDEWGIYSVGRFATWRQLLLDDVVNDISVVDSFITQRDNYSRKLRTQQ